MTTVRLSLPPQVIDELDLPPEGLRGANDFLVAIEGLNVSASIVTLSALKPRAVALVNALRSWRRQTPGEPVVLTVSGPGVELRIKLPRNVQTSEVLAQIQPLMNRPT